MSSGDPAQAEAVRQAVRESIDELDLSPTEVSALLEVLEYMSQRPDEYPALRQRLIESGMMDDDDLPEEYDPAFLGMAIMALNEYKAAGAQGAQAPMEMSPVVEGLEPMAMAEGGLADVAKYLASQGRNGDSILAHITPAEARLLKAMGGSGTINPQTGLPEFFLKKIFKSVKKAVKKLLKNPIVRIVATVALAAVLGPAAISAVGGLTGAATVAAGTAGASIGLGGTAFALSTSAAAAATAAASVVGSAAISAMAGEKINAKNLLVNAATSYFGAGGAVGKFAPLKTATDLAGRIPGVTAGSKVAQSLGSGLTGAAIGRAAGLSTEEALGMGLQAGASTYFSKYTKPLSQSTDAELKAQGYSDEAIQRIRAEASAPTTAPPAGSGQPPATQAAPATQAPAANVPAAGSPASMTDAQLFGMGYTPDEISAFRAGAQSPIGGAAGTSLTPESTAFGRMGDFIKTLAPGGEAPSFDKFKNAFLVNPDAKEGSLSRYVPGVATALTVSGLAGGFKTGKVDENPLFDRDYTGSDYIRDNPEKFKGGLEPTVLKPYNPVVETPSYGLGPSSTAPGPSTTAPGSFSTMPVGPTPTYYAPSSSPTNMPQGIPQPYNVSGLYGVPLLYGNPVQAARPPGYRQGGAVNNAIKQAAQDPVQVAQTEGLLYSGPQAAQAAGQAVQALTRQNNQGIMAAQGLRRGGQPTHFPRKTGPINGPGTGTSDSIPAMLSDGEFVFTARAVRNAGGGSRRKGARRMYKLMKMLEGGKAEGK
jgi:hypothetical protein